MHVVSAARARGVTSFPVLARSSPVQYEILRAFVAKFDEFRTTTNAQGLGTRLLEESVHQDIDKILEKPQA